MYYSCRKVKAFGPFTGKTMINNYWLESEFGIEHVYRIV